MRSTLGVLIREARERAGLTQADVARRAGTSQPAIARYEAGLARPRLETAQRCVEACGFELRIELEQTSFTATSGGRGRFGAQRGGSPAHERRVHQVRRRAAPWVIRMRRRAGMDPAASASAAQSRGLPRTRGDGPVLPQHARSGYRRAFTTSGTAVPLPPDSLFHFPDSLFHFLRIRMFHFLRIRMLHFLRIRMFHFARIPCSTWVGIRRSVAEARGPDSCYVLRDLPGPGATGSGPEATSRFRRASTRAANPSIVRAPSRRRSPGRANTTSSTVSKPLLCRYA